MFDPASGDNTESNESRQSVFSKLAQGYSALLHRDFCLLWIGTFASNNGSWSAESRNCMADLPNHQFNRLARR
jgi:hypothetical protein